MPLFEEWKKRHLTWYCPKWAEDIAVKCNKCNGRGQIPARAYTLNDLFSYSGPWKKCPKCGGSGEYTPSHSSGSSHSGSSHSSQPRKESAWREKSCPGYGSGYCGKTIKYRTDWDNIPNLCPECKQKEKNANRPQRERTHRPERTSQWQEKHCGVATCNTPIRYLPSWNNIPSYCPQHLQEMRQRQHPSYDEANSKEYPSIYAALPGSSSSAADMGADKAVVLGFSDGHKHVTVYHGQKGEPGNWRYSWNVDSSGRYQTGSAHFSDDGSGLVRGKFSDERRWFNG